MNHLLSGGIWLRVYRKNFKLMGDLMCLELPQLAELGEELELKHLHLDKQIKKKRDYLSVHMYRVWGKKLREVKKYLNASL